MDKLIIQAEEEMKKLRQPYVGTHHLFLAYLKEYELETMSYQTFYEYVLKIIGSCYKENQYVLYTPYLSNLKESIHDIREAIVKILSDSDSIVYNILLSKKVDVDKILGEVSAMKI